MRILYAITRSEWGGAQAHLFELVKDQVSRGNEVYVVVGKEGQFSEKIKKLDNVHLFIQRSLIRELNPLKDIIAIRDFRRLIKRLDPDIIHLHSSKAGAVGRIAAMRSKAKIIFTAHGWAFTEGIEEKKRRVFILIERTLARITDKIICVSKYDYNLALKEKVASQSKMVVIYNGVQDPEFEREFFTKEDRINILMVARFDKPKNQQLLIRAFSKLPRNKYTLTLVGDGPLLQQSIELTSNLNISDSVRFVGFQSDVNSYLRQADIFSLITNYEGLPISIIEAMSYSLPIIASNVGGISELVKDNGYLVENKIDSVVEAINKIDLSAVKNLSKNSYVNYRKEFELVNVLFSIDKLYNSKITD